MIEKIIYKKNQDLFELIIDIFNSEVEKFGLGGEFPQKFIPEKVYIYFLDENNILEYLGL